jgi:hypothetical protein
MHRALWIARKNYLCSLVKKVSDLNNGDDIEFIKEYCRELLISYPNEKIEEPIKCYEEIIENSRYYYDRRFKWMR